MIAEIPILREAVPAAPMAGKRLFAMAAPDWTLIIAKRTAGIGGILSSLFFILLLKYSAVKLQNL
jgi:hypothetical protein